MMSIQYDLKKLNHKEAIWDTAEKEQYHSTHIIYVWPSKLDDGSNYYYVQIKQRTCLGVTYFTRNTKVYVRRYLPIDGIIDSSGHFTIGHLNNCG
jgi:phage terminase large subunit-like protein